MADRPLVLKGGAMLTDELLEKLVVEAERGYDLSKAKRVYLREGRPPKEAASSGESPRVASRVPQQVVDAARERAESEGLSMSELIRALLAGYAAGKMRAARADSDLTAARTNSGGRRRTSSVSNRATPERRRAPTTKRGRRKPALADRADPKNRRES